MSDTLNDKTGGFKVGDKVVLEGVVSGIEASWSHPLKVTMKGGKHAYFRPDHLRHADAAPNATEIAVPLYRTPPDAQKRIEELEAEVESLRGKVASHEAEITLWTKDCERMRKIKADKQVLILHLESKLAAQRRVKAGLNDVIRDRNERIKELEAELAGRKAACRIVSSENQDWRDMVVGKNTRIRQLEGHLASPREVVRLKRRVAELEDTLQKITYLASCNTTCDSSDQCCNTKPAEPATTVDDVATDHIVEPNKMVVAPKGVKERIGCLVMEMRNSDSQKQRCEAAEEIWQSLKEIVELPEPNKHVTIQESNFGGFNVLMDSRFWFFVNSHNALPLAAALIKAAKGGAK
jgi:hypothetical protein